MILPKLAEVGVELQPLSSSSSKTKQKIRKRLEKEKTEEMKKDGEKKKTLMSDSFSDWEVGSPTVISVF